MEPRPTTYVHPSALCECETLGAGSRVWAFAHVMRGAKVGVDCNIGEGAFVESGASLGDRVTVKNHALVWDGVEIADDVFVGPGVVFTNDRFPRSRRMHHPAVTARYEGREWLERTRVERGASLGAGAVILCGLTIGAHATIAAGAVVTADVSSQRLVAGNPARAIGWVCACGARLDEALACACGARHALRDGRLERGE